MQYNLHSTLWTCILYNLTKLAMSDYCIKYGTVQDDMSMKKYTFRHVDKSSLYECAAECMASSSCESFNFDTRSRICHLNSNSSDHVDFNPQSGVLFSDIKHWKYIMTRSCSTASCSASPKCQTVRNRKQHCVEMGTEFKGCGKPPEVADADVTYNGHFLHAEANYTCEPDFRSCTPQKGSVCQATGQWTIVKHVCERFRWLNPIVIFEGNIPCKHKRSHIIQIKATPTKKTSMNFNLMRGRDILFHMSARFHWGSSRKMIAYNTFLDGNWGSEIRPAGFPFIIDEPFKLRITLENGMYKISVNGTRFKPFTERILEAKPDKIQISEDIRVESVEIIV